MNTEITIQGTTYGLTERSVGQHYEAVLEKDPHTCYTVRCHHGAWWCNCPDQHFRGRKSGDPCKHILHLKRRREEQQTSPLPPEQQASAEAREEYQRKLTMTPENNSGTLTASQPTQVRSAPPANALPSVTSQSGRTQLCIALAKAQQVVGRVAHDGEVSFNGKPQYGYTSSEAIIEVAKAALGGNGLCLLPLEETLNGHEKEGANRFELECKFVLLHVSGEQLPLIRHWPVCPQQGRALDKATAAASTLCLAYLLRDLLLIPRVNPEDEVAARNDQQPARQQQTAAPTGQPTFRKKKADLPRDGAELEVRLKTREAKLVVEGVCQAGDLLTAVRTAGVKAGYVAEISRWSAPAIELAWDTAKEFIAKCRAGDGPVHAK